jgi:hypothetical protein
MSVNEKAIEVVEVFEANPSTAWTASTTSVT